MPHDEHFLGRLDRVPREHVELALGLYRDHELVKALLADARLPAGAGRVALALEDGGGGRTWWWRATAASSPASARG
jgi:hypothetical protein